MLIYEKTIVEIVEKASHKDYLLEIKDQAIKDELTLLWDQISCNCKEIIDSSISLLHQDPSSMVEELLNELQKE